MRRRNFLAAGGAAGLAATFSGLATATPTVARPAQAAGKSAPSDSLRSLAAKIGLRVGTAVIPFDLDTPAYAAVLASQFSVVTPGNEMKWQVVEPTQGVFDWSGADRLVNFAEANEQLVRGHTLLWHNQLPTWLTTGVANGTISRTQLMDLLEAHIFTEVGRYKGRIWQWDVANEFFLDSNPSGINPGDFWVSNLGTGIIPQAFRWARQADPVALLMYNDYNIAGEDGSNAKSDAVYAWLQQMLDQGVPVSGVGNQGHLDTQFGFPTQMQQDFAAVRQPRPQGCHHRSRCPYFCRWPDDSGTDRSTRLVRAAVRVRSDDEGRPRGAGVHLLYLLGLRGRRLLDPRFFHRRGLRHAL